MSKHHANLDPWCKADLDRFQAQFTCDMLTQMVDHYRRYTQPSRWATAWGCWRATARCEISRSSIRTSIAWRRSTPCCRAAASMPPDELRSALEKLVSEYALEWQWDRAHQIADEFHAAGHITAVDYEQIKLVVDGHRERRGNGGRAANDASQDRAH